MAKDMIHKQQRRDICLFYFVADPTEYCYQQLWTAAAVYGLRVIPLLTNEQLAATWHGKVGRLTDNLLSSEVKDYAERRYYLSGPNALVNNYRQLLRNMGISRRNTLPTTLAAINRQA